MINPKKILILSANPKATPRLRLDEEVREIEDGLRLSKRRDQFEIKSVWAVRKIDLRRALLDNKPDIVHFIGHGKKDGLMVEDELGFTESFSAKALAGLFEMFSHHVECVILSACYSASYANAISKHINYVIGMTQDINDKAAIEFLVGFYDALGAGKSIEEAYLFGRNALFMQMPYKNITPVLLKSYSLQIEIDKGNHLLESVAIYSLFFISVLLILSLPVINIIYDLPFFASIGCWLATLGLSYEVVILFPKLNEWRKDNNDYPNR